MRIYIFFYINRIPTDSIPTFGSLLRVPTPWVDSLLSTTISPETETISPETEKISPHAETIIPEAETIILESETIIPNS